MMYMNVQITDHVTYDYYRLGMTRRSLQEVDYKLTYQPVPPWGNMFYTKSLLE